MAELLNREIFSTGKHNGQNYTGEMLDDLVQASKELDYEPAVKLGHKDDDAAPAYGYVRNLRRMGEKLIADFFDLPEELYQKIMGKQYNRVSIEVYKNLERGGKKYRWALKAVALLGAAIPGVAGLRPLSELFAENKGEELFLDVEADVDPLAFADEIKAARKTFISLGSGSHAGLWNKYGSFTKCVGGMSSHMDNPEAFCAWLEHEATGKWPAEKHSVPDGQEWSDFVLDAILKENFGMDTNELKARLDKLENESKANAAAKEKAEADLKAAQDKFAEDLAAIDKKHSDETEAREKKFREEQEANIKRIAKMEAKERASDIEKLSETCRIPSLRPFIKQFAQLSDKAGTEVKLFGQKDKDGKDTEVTPDEALASFIDHVNKSSAKLFTVISHEDDPTGENRRHAGDSADDEVDEKVRKYMHEHPDVDYQKAMDKVLDADPVLKKRFAESSTAQAV